MCASDGYRLGMLDVSGRLRRRRNLRVTDSKKTSEGRR